MPFVDVAACDGPECRRRKQLHKPRSTSFTIHRLCHGWLYDPNWGTWCSEECYQVWLETRGHKPRD